MADKRLRQRIAQEAARLLFHHQEEEYPRAKRRAARKLGLRFKPDNLPSNREIREHLDQIERSLHPDRLEDDLRALRIEALRVMRLLREFSPRLVGSVWTGAARPGDPIRLEAFADDPSLVRQSLARLGRDVVTALPRRLSWASERQYTPIRVSGPVACDVSVLPADLESAVPTGAEAAPFGSIRQLEEMLVAASSAEALENELDGIDPRADRFDLYRCALEQLEDVQQDPRRHPEGDALYHSLQVFDLAVLERPYDEEFLTAALLHEVGKAIDRADPVCAALELLDGLITRRTSRLIGRLHEAREYRNRESTPQARKELEGCEDFEDLLTLAELDEKGRRRGVGARSIDEAIAYLRALDDGSFWEASDDEHKADEGSDEGRAVG